MTESLLSVDPYELRARVRAYRSFPAFVRRIAPTHGSSDHLRPVFDVWQRAATERVFACIEMPPRHGKTTTAMEGIAWHIHRRPDLTSAYATYAQALARSKSRAMRVLALQAGVQLDNAMANLDEWRTTMGGGLLATGVGGPLTGQGVSGVLVVDDALKNREEANSEVTRETIWDWFRDVAWTRLEGDASVIVMATRWHEDDLIGKLLRNELGVRFERVRLPAIAEPNDPLGRVEGEALWPERFPLPVLEQIRGMLGSYSWASLYQQAPAPAEGGIFKRHWWKYYDELPRMFELTMSVDCSFKETKDGSRVAILVVGRGESVTNRYIVDNDTRPMDFVETVDTIRAMLKKHPRITKVIVEDKANGPAVINMLKRDLNNVIEIKPEGGKEARAYAAQPQVEAGNVYLPKRAAWLEAFLHELSTFPNGTHDDQVDALTQALNYMAGSADVHRARMLGGNW